ncbi:methyltransferase [Oceanicoccus sp. KOV_DT_Chl]|uniref:methyltransferase n=1 Tax=Oceanicoccus sp. KOV_DT_Chl TaxID=1904639 RepID=UPI000C7AC791|nr:methyltransferase [Oceanicoccus sp. KOV_DT_Chl]
MDQLETAFASLQLERLPLEANTKNLRAWDAADELMLTHLDQHSILTPNSSILIANDNFGALACSLHQYQCHHWGDSYISHQAILHNQQLNQLTPAEHTLSSMTPLQHEYDVVLLKIPKSNALLEQQLIDLQTAINTTTIIIAAGMVKYLTKAQLQLFEKYIGTTTTSLASKKARLIFSIPKEKNEIGKLHREPYPSIITIDELNLVLSNYANVFSREKLDIGSRFFLQQFQHMPLAEHIVDLGCGNGLLGIMAQRQQPNSQLYFVDESYMAVASAQLNYHNNINPSDINGDKTPIFKAGDGLEPLATMPIELILCNPPFHQNNTVGDHIAQNLFHQSHQHLSQGGALWVVGNRHLNYHITLKRIFGNCRTVAGNQKFVVLAANKR